MRKAIFLSLIFTVTLAHGQLSLTLHNGAELRIDSTGVMVVPDKVLLYGDSTRLRVAGILSVEGTAPNSIEATGGGIVCLDPTLNCGVEWSMTNAAAYEIPFIRENGSRVPVTVIPATGSPTRRILVATVQTSPTNQPLPSTVANTNGPAGPDLAASMVDRYWRITPNELSEVQLSFAFNSQEDPQMNAAPLRTCTWGGTAWNYPLPDQVDQGIREVHLLNATLQTNTPTTYTVASNEAFGMDTRLAVHALLGGAYDPISGSMRDDLRMLPTFPPMEPYSAAGLLDLPYSGGEHIDPAVLEVAGQDAIVDWILIKLRNEQDPSIVLAERSGLLQRDGDIVDVDGFSPLKFQMPSGNYRISVHHRNHLGAMTSIGFPITVNAVSGTIDLSDPDLPTYGMDARQLLDGSAMLWPGDVSGDGKVTYTGIENDRDPILFFIGGTVTTNVVSGSYTAEDVNLDGLVKYTGAGNDRDIILQTIGGMVPTVVRVEQLP